MPSGTPNANDGSVTSVVAAEAERLPAVAVGEYVFSWNEVGDGDVP
jgi:hypothetical protein